MKWQNVFFFNNILGLVLISGYHTCALPSTGGVVCTGEFLKYVKNIYDVIWYICFFFCYSKIRSQWTVSFFVFVFVVCVCVFCFAFMLNRTILLLIRISMNWILRLQVMVNWQMTGDGILTDDVVIRFVCVCLCMNERFVTSL